jgi:hypothetical protein
MRLDRNTNPDEHGKYALLKVRRLNDFREQSAFGPLAPKIAEAIKILEAVGAVDWGAPNTESEFFVIRLKDKYAQGALNEYALAAYRDGETAFADDVRGLATRAGPDNQWCKKPD